MGSRKQNSADKRKEARKTTYLARLSNCPTSPTKMALVAELMQGKNVYQALNILHFSPKHAAKKMEKLLTSAISNFEQKSGERAEESNLYVKTVFVEGAATLNRFRPAPHGRAYRIRKRSNHVTLIVDKRVEEASAEAAAVVTETNSA